MNTYLQNQFAFLEAGRHGTLLQMLAEGLEIDIIMPEALVERLNGGIHGMDVASIYSSTLKHLYAHKLDDLYRATWPALNAVRYMAWSYRYLKQSASFEQFTRLLECDGIRAAAATPGLPEYLKESFDEYIGLMVEKYHYTHVASVLACFKRPD
ncbi:hypothetical protein ACI2KR_06405 [Pseudomonas luteola]